MANRYSIAEARDHLARLVHQAEKGAPVEITRRGRPVAFLVSLGLYQRLHGGVTGFWEALEQFRSEVDLAEAGIEPDTFEGLRDRGTGREVRL